MKINRRIRVFSWILTLTMICSMVSLPQFDIYAAEQIISDAVSVEGSNEVTTPSAISVNSKVLDVNKLSTGNIVKNTSIEDYFTVAASDKKAVTIEATEQIADDGIVFTQRLKLNGTGSKEARSIHFATTDKATIEIYAMSGSGTEDRKLGLFKKDTEDSIEEVTALKDGIVKSTINLKDAGEYYLASLSSGINVYLIRVTIGAAPVEPERPEWSTVAAPTITSVEYKDSDKKAIQVNFTLDISQTGADKAVVEMQDETGTVVGSTLVGRSENATKTATLTPEKSGNYYFVVKAQRKGEEPISSSLSDGFNYSLPLTAPVVSAYNKGKGKVLVKWLAVAEAEKYQVEYKLPGEAYVALPEVTTLETLIPSLKVENNYTMRVTAIRGDDKITSKELQFQVKDEVEREWAFTYFGQSSDGNVNTFKMLDSEPLKFQLNACTVNKDGTINKKGGKFTTFHDGISFYYTPIDAATENFELTATFTLDYINKTPDGQEGFGLLVMDSLGEHGKGSPNHYTNSAAILATKFDKKEAGVVVASSKDTIGSRFVSGLTPEVLNSGDSAIAKAGKNVSEGYSYAPEDLVKQGTSYTLTLKKTNTGYHTILNNDPATERIMYNPAKLLQLDDKKVYVGFAAARGCNVTVSNVSMKFTDPVTDAPALPEPVETIDLITKIDSPVTSSSADYKFVFNANANGQITIKDAKGNLVTNHAKVVAGTTYTNQLVLAKGQNDYKVIFQPDAGFTTASGAQLKSYEEVILNHSVSYKGYTGTTLFVAPNGKSSNIGTKASPLDLYTATQYVKPGQVICLEGGTYNMPSKLIIPRGINGTEKARITLKSAKGSRAILNFKEADGGMQLWSDYWHIYGIDVCETTGNVKGLQIAGNNNIVEFVNTYRNGDTGLQISGLGTEGYDQWPANNLILNCTSYDNCDPGENNADGFAAKITCGPGNVFRGCISHHNLDDGWDLFSKIESGPIGAVVLENCITYNNGTLTNGHGNGDGNGFKLGGDGIAVPHVLRNSISFNNNVNGITSNSDPAIVLENNTAFGNKGLNISIYGKGTGERSFVATNNLSMAGGKADDYSEMPSLATENNYFFDGTKCMNKLGEVFNEDIFVSTDMTIMPTRTKEGFIDMNGLLELNNKARAGIGAVIKSTKGPIEVAMESQAGSSSSESSNSGSSSTPKSSSGSSASPSPQTTITLEEQIKLALKYDMAPQLSVDKNNAVSLSNSTVKELVESGKTLGVSINENIKLVLKSETLKEQGNESIVIKAAVTNQATSDKIAKVLKDNKDIVVFNNNESLFTLSVNTKKPVEQFNEPISITFNLPKENGKNPSKLTVVRYEEQENGTFKAVKIGGTYDTQTGKFNCLTDKPGVFGLAISEDLVKLNLAIGNKQAAVNDAAVANDVAPELVNGRTMLPVRFITESLGGKVGWEKGRVIITIDDKTMSFKVGETLAGYDVQPFMKDSRTFVPIRWVADELDANVLWVPSDQKVEIVK